VAPLAHVGRWLTDAGGRVVILHGLNMVFKRAPFTPSAAGFGAVAAAALASNGFNVVRLGVLYQGVEPAPGVIDASYLKSIATTVAQLASHGVYALLDFHQDQMNQEFGGEGFPKWSVETDGLKVKKYVFPLGYLDSAALNRAYSNFWADKPGPHAMGLQHFYDVALEAVARKFSTDPWVLGYDLFNEPWPASGTTAQLASFYEGAISSIRSVDRSHLIWYEPWVTFDFGTQTQLPAFSDAGLGMSFHDYCLSSSNCATTEQNTIANALARSTSTSAALLLTEFGATDNYQSLGHVVGLADANRLPWIEWSYCGCKDPTGTIPPTIEGLVVNPKLPATGTNVNEAKLKVLAEPYPTVISGTPSSYQFDAVTGTLHFSYTANAPSGHAFAAGACTAIEIPSVQYPTGYEVAVIGGQVRSKPDAGVLEIVSTVDSGTISVTVTPGSGGTTTASGPVPASCTA
jgi:endoglycosylceramidase